MRIRLSNIPPMWGVTQVRKHVAETLGIPQDSVLCQKGLKSKHAFLSFRPTEELSTNLDLETFRSKLAISSIRNKTLSAKIEEDAEDITANEEVGIKSLNDQVTPLWKMPYEEQLSRKHHKFHELLQKNVNLSKSFIMEPIKGSPVVEGYRNKCEFTIGFDTDAQPTVGFTLGLYKDGIVTVENASDTVHTPQILKNVANHLQDFVRSSDLPVYDRHEKRGFWRLLLARVHDGNVMIAIQITTNGMDEERKKTIFDDIVTHMKGIHEIRSIFIQDSNAVHNGIDVKTPFKLFYGSETVTQTLCGLKFNISPLSFFQVNQTATEILYETVKNYVVDSLSADTVLLDLCCGTGTIGMTLAPFVGKVIGVEIVPDAIVDAKTNAKLNNISNIQFECNRVEAAIDKIISNIPAETPIVVVLDPPRSGVHPSVIKAVRRCARISRVVFVSCNPEAAVNNFVDLSKDDAGLGSPFKLYRAVAVDLFPMTEHCELVLQFNREK